jgi:16S rRNA (cytosine967-C5)-methyltransferase
LSTAFSLPNWLIADWLAEFGFEKTRHICFGSNRRPGVYIRPNPLKTTIEDLADKLQQADIVFDIVPDAPMIRISSGKAVTQLPGFAEGLFTVQDLTASQAVRMLAPKPGSKILDLCAAPGVKITQLAEITGDAAEIVATDINPDRLALIEQNTARLGITSV